MSRHARRSKSRTARSRRSPAGRRSRSRRSSARARSNPLATKQKRRALAGRFAFQWFAKSVVEEASELAAARRVLQLAQRLGLDLADALAGHRELLADLFQGVVGVHADAEAHAQHALLARGERGQHPRRGLAQVGGDRRLVGQDGVLVLDEIAEMRILLV